jgi:hypothetical protein
VVVAVVEHTPITKEQEMAGLVGAVAEQHLAPGVLVVGQLSTAEKTGNLLPVIVAHRVVMVVKTLVAAAAAVTGETVMVLMCRLMGDLG